MTLDHLAPHVRGLGALAARLLRDHHAGEDLAQDAFLRAAQAERMPEPSAGSGPWLRTIARRLASNERRSRARRRDAEASLALDRAGAAAPS